MSKRNGDPRFYELLDRLADLHDRKQADYGRRATNTKAADPFANVRASEDWGIEPWVGAMIRANDKVRRLQSAAQGSELANEGIADSLEDLAVYAMIARILYGEANGEYDD